jgi:transmembrane sensor
MEEERYLDLMAKYLSGNLSDAERATLLAWVESDEANKKFFDEMIELWSVSASYDNSAFSADVEKAWNRLERRLDEQPGSSTVLSLRTKRLRWLRYAAVFLLAVAASIWLFRNVLIDPLLTIQSGQQEQIALLLPDSSKVWLNQNSTLRYPRRFQERKVWLDGEALFEVEHDADRPFQVLSGASKTTVLGTIFNVRGYAGENRVEVTVLSGRVRLEQPRRVEAPLILEQNQSGVADESEGLILAEKEISNATSWHTGMLSFDSTRLAEALPALERHFGIRLETDNPAILRCTWTLTKPLRNPSLEAILMTLEFMFPGIEIEEKDENWFLVSGKGCD